MKDFWIGGWRVEPEVNRITRGEEVRRLEPRVMDLLVYLVAHAGEVISRDRLIRAVWPDSFVTDGALSYSMAQLRQLLGDDAREPRFVETIQRRGYRLIAGVTFEEPAREESHYELLEKLGEGGTGEVHLARDTILNRRVALKFLQPEKEKDELWLRRLTREAQAAAALDHPYICKVYETGRLEGRDFIAMEYVDGEKLSRRIEQGPLPLTETVRIASEIAEALECAHGNGFLHRDIKPSNVILTAQGHVKITDFGIAKRFRRDVGESEEGTLTDVSQKSPGTPDYMSPEQIRGEPLDQRSDLFQFGMVLYQMLTGVHPFRRETKAETSAAILGERPRSVGEFRAPTPELQLLQHLVGKMLAKEPEQRYQLTHEVLTDLNRLRDDSATGSARREPVGRIPTGLWVILLAAVAAVAIWALWFKAVPARGPGPLTRSSIVLPEGERLASGSTFRHAVAVSPDGRWVAYASYRPGTDQKPDGQPVIDLRRLDRTEVRRMPGMSPFFSPDSKQLGFVERRTESQFGLVRTPVEGGPVESVATFPDLTGEGGFGSTWLLDDRIVFAFGDLRGLFVVPSVGGEPRQLTRPDAETGEIGHRFPVALADGSTVLYTAVRFYDWSHARIMALNLETGESKLLVEGGSDARYADSGHLLFAREGRLMAVAFDPERLEVRGEPVPVLDGLVHSVNTGTRGRETGAAQYALSRNGMLLFGPGSGYPEQGFDLVRVDRTGREEALALQPRKWLSARLSADSRKVLLVTNYPPHAVWLFDFERKTLRRQTFEGRARWAIWGPEVGEFTYGGGVEGPQAIRVKQVDVGIELGEKLATGFSADHFPSSWSPEGRYLAFTHYSRDTGHDIWIYDRDERSSRPYLQTRFDEVHPDFSPDGKWLAYTSNESGRDEVYMCPFAGRGIPRQISTTGGRAPCWSRDGGEIFYELWEPHLLQRAYFAVRLTAREDEPQPGLPQRLFALEGEYVPTFPIREYDVDQAGRFLLKKWDWSAVRMRELEAMAPSRIELVQNWFQELRARVPVD